MDVNDYYLKLAQIRCKSSLQHDNDMNGDKGSNVRRNMNNVEGSKLLDDVFEYREIITSKNSLDTSTCFKSCLDEIDNKETYINKTIISDNVNELKTNKFKTISTSVYHPAKLVAIEKLESALKYLGFNLTAHQKVNVRKGLSPDNDGKVKYGEFVEVVKEVLDMKDAECYSNDKTHFLYKNLPLPSNSYKKTVEFSVDQTRFFVNKIEKLKTERDDAIRREQCLRHALMEKDSICLLLKNELKTSQLTTSNVEDELSILKDKCRLPPGTEPGKFQKPSVIVCKLHKAETLNHAYEVCISKLIKFIEKVQSTLRVELKKSTMKSRGNKHLNVLLNGTNEIINSVKTLLEEEPLPYGWEKAYSSDKTHFYINHLTQKTSWVHPVTSMKHAVKIKGSKVKKC